MQDFNTIQQLFATNMHGIMTKQQGATPPTNPDLNTMQQLFATGTYNQMSKPSVGQSSGQQVQGTVNDLNTMQYLFATSNVQG